VGRSSEQSCLSNWEHCWATQGVCQDLQNRKCKCLLIQSFRGLRRGCRAHPVFPRGCVLSQCLLAGPVVLLQGVQTGTPTGSHVLTVGRPGRLCWSDGALGRHSNTCNA
jgi:hypothetical protein